MSESSKQSAISTRLHALSNPSPPIQKWFTHLATTYDSFIHDRTYTAQEKIKVHEVFEQVLRTLDHGGHIDIPRVQRETDIEIRIVSEPGSRGWALAGHC
jgi:hypothetical protein